MQARAPCPQPLTRYSSRKISARFGGLLFMRAGPEGSGAMWTPTAVRRKVRCDERRFDPEGPLRNILAGLIAFASAVLDDQLFLSGIAIRSKLVGSGYRVTYPTRK